MDGRAVHGLTAAELALAAGELHQQLAGAAVIDAVPLRTPAGMDDVLLVLRRDDPAGGKVFVHVACGGVRARIAITTKRFPAAQHALGPAADALRAALDGATLSAVTAARGERRCSFSFATPHGGCRLEVELFSARGLWALCDAGGRVLALSRPVTTAVRALAPGTSYVAPAVTERSRPEPAPRFTPPVLPAIDACFTAFDVEHEARAALATLQRGAERALRRARQKVEGHARQLAAAAGAGELRATADLMLAYAHTVQRGQTSMTVPDPAVDGATRTIQLAPDQPVAAQARSLYEQARRLDEGRAGTSARLAAARALVAELEDLERRLAAPEPAPDLEPLRLRLVQLGALPRPATTSRRGARPALPFRRFVSAEGYLICVGRNNAENDALTMRFANGNDLWLHVGGGRAGSHVVVRLPKQKTASLDTLLDAATLAVHFSKARGAARIDVVYTQRKHVRKPKGLPAGAVVPSRTRTITVQHDGARLRRLLDSASSQDQEE